MYSYILGGGTQMFYPSQAQSKAQSIPAPLAQREKHVIPIIDPNTKQNILDDMSPKSSSKPSYSPSPVQSRDSSASNTPAPVSMKLIDSELFPLPF